MVSEVEPPNGRTIIGFSLLQKQSLRGYLYKIRMNAPHLFLLRKQFMVLFTPLTKKSSATASIQTLSFQRK
jgi:hypothetical protein